MKFLLKEVRTKRDLRRFVRLPDTLYACCPQYVPALHSDQIKSLTSVSTLTYCKTRKWLVENENGKAVGRICAAINPRYNELYGTKRVRFGWFDCIDNREVAQMLFSAAEDWARGEGMNEIHGPLYYNTLGKQGLLIEGFSNIPPFNCLYNFPYYRTLIESLGFQKECDWVQYKLPVDQELPEKTIKISKLVSQRYGLREGNLDRLKKNRGEVLDFFRMYSSAFSGNVQNFIPFTDDEMNEEADSVMPFVSDKYSSVIMDGNGSPVAFGISFPSISTALQKARGRLFPFGWLHLLKAMRGGDTVDLMISGAAPEWKGKGLSAMYFVSVWKKMRSHGVKWVITNPQIETNDAVKLWNSYEKTPYMRRRCFVKKIS